MKKKSNEDAEKSTKPKLRHKDIIRLFSIVVDLKRARDGKHNLAITYSVSSEYCISRVLHSSIFTVSLRISDCNKYQKAAYPYLKTFCKESAFCNCGLFGGFRMYPAENVARV